MIHLTLNDGTTDHVVELAEVDEHGQRITNEDAIVRAETSLRQWAEHGTVKVGKSLKVKKLERDGDEE